ncbi:MAG: tetratricopeptide repeat protein [Deltaproteobacteria bacterium]|nr:tetratricopeptide repeat protein [Deltaproteobacteria bacterium]
MDITKQIQSLFNEAKVYQSQSLFAEAKEKYIDTARLIQKSERLKDKNKLITIISNRLKALENDVNSFEKLGASPRMSVKEQGVVKESLFISKDKKTDSYALEVAAALLGFGQFEQAIKEFEKLLKRDTLRVAAAKNIIRCHIAVSSLKSAVDQYQKWLDADFFPSDQLEKIRFFVEAILKRKGINKILPRREGTTADKAIETKEEAVLDIISVIITLDKGPKKEEGLALDVSSQTGNIISVIVSDQDQGFIDNLEVGSRLDDVQFFSPIAVQRGSGIVSGKTLISSGQKKGSYSVVIKML